MRYVTARIEQEDRDEAYRIYVTDSLRSLTGAKIRYYEIINPAPEETRTSEEVKQGVFSKLKQMEDTA